MRAALLSWGVPVAVAVAGMAALVLWARTTGRVEVEPRLPRQDGAPLLPAEATQARTAPEEPVAGPGKPSAETATWPWFRGPQGDAIAKPGVRLARQWPAAGPKKLWQVTLGEGYAAPVVAHGCLYVLDHWHDEACDLVREMPGLQREGLAAALAKLPAEPKPTPQQITEMLSTALRGGAPGVQSTSALPPAEKLTAAAELLAEWIDRDAGTLVAALAKNRVDDLDRSRDVMRCLALDDGREVWSNGYRTVVPLHHGYTRTVAAVVGDIVISFGPKCHVVAWDAKTGAARWMIDLVLDHGATVPEWYAGQCPYIDTKLDQLVLAPGGKALLMAVDYRTGEIKWQSPNPRGWKMTHVSIAPMEFGGRRQYVYSGSGGVAGVDADNGEILWDTTAWQIPMAACATPVPIGDGRIFFCGGYNAGAMMLRIEQSGGRFAARKLFALDAGQFSSEQQTPILFENHLYGIRQKDKKFVCLDLDGKEKWSSGRDKFGASPYLLADGLFYVVSDAAQLSLIEATPSSYKRLAKAQILEDGVDAWGPLAMVGSRLLMRDLTRLVCLEVGIGD